MKSVRPKIKKYYNFFLFKNKGFTVLVNPEFLQEIRLCYRKGKNSGFKFGVQQGFAKPIVKPHPKEILDVVLG